MLSCHSSLTVLRVQIYISLPTPPILCGQRSRLANAHGDMLQPQNHCMFSSTISMVTYLPYSATGPIPFESFSLTVRIRLRVFVAANAATAPELAASINKEIETTFVKAWIFYI